MDSLFRKFRSSPSSSTGTGSGDTNGTSVLPGNNKPVTLYLIRLSPPCRAVWLYLAQNKIPYALVDIDPAAPVDSNGRRPELPSSLPHQDVPILVDGEVTIFEGPAIIRYLSTRYTNYKGYGVTVSERMMVESLIAWAHNDLHSRRGVHPPPLDLRLTASVLGRNDLYLCAIFSLGYARKSQNKIPYALVDIDPAAPVDSNGRRPELPSSLPHQDVPILVDGEVTIFEGPAIIRYSRLATQTTRATV
ncbi:uncharacterized protein LOC117288878 [Asterias rubens]|uniref:uncharacterized protein LOC117288878 n=1 Tax=Asterias rubens TaxID=7604 RepID=UPI0014551F66|nr:uncharacterized protein LOC117288878 [Asterias rubens]